jgi:hypothetical protein
MLFAFLTGKWGILSGNGSCLVLMEQVVLLQYVKMLSREAGPNQFDNALICDIVK